MKIKLIKQNMLQDNFLNDNIFSESSINPSLDNKNCFDFLDRSKDILSIEPFENYLSFGGEACSKSEDKKLKIKKKMNF